MSFATKVRNAASLTGLRFLSEVGLRLISTVVLTRLLMPETYGVFAIVMTYLYLIEMFSDLGVRTLVLTKEGEVEDGFLRTCWTISILRGLLVLGISGLLAAPVGWFLWP